MSDSLCIKSHLRDYTVHFVRDFCLPIQEFASQNSFFIVDSSIWEIFKEKLKNKIPDKRLLIIEANENNKSLDKCREVVETLVDRQFRRNEKMVAVGGGIIQDVTAFSASIIYRGVEWAFIPTTLLAQADSCIGSKTSINLGDRKNLVGNFYPPSGIFIDTSFLLSLSEEDIKSGIGEIMHYYIYSGSPLLEELIKDYAITIEDRSLLLKYVQESLKIKKSVIEIDEFDRGERNKFNYGHTFGHAIESITGYAIKHGRAVTIGMDLANYISMETGLMLSEIFHDLHKKLSINFPEYDWTKINFDRFFDLLSKDKKNVGSNVGCILAKNAGILIKQQLPLDDNFKKKIQVYFTEKKWLEGTF